MQNDIQPDPICRNCKWNGLGCIRPETDDFTGHDIPVDRNNGGSNCEAHEYELPHEPWGDDKYEKGEK